MTCRLQFTSNPVRPHARSYQTPATSKTNITAYICKSPANRIKKPGIPVDLLYIPNKELVFARMPGANHKYTLLNPTDPRFEQIKEFFQNGINHSDHSKSINRVSLPLDLLDNISQLNQAQYSLENFLKQVPEEIKKVTEEIYQTQDKLWNTIKE